MKKKTCKTKVKYKTFGEAWRHSIKMLDKLGFDNSPYKCTCGYYHLTSKYDLNGERKYNLPRKNYRIRHKTKIPVYDPDLLQRPTRVAVRKMKWFEKLINYIKTICK